MNLQINWTAIEVDLNLYQGGDPEGILHEISHAYDVLDPTLFEKGVDTNDWCTFEDIISEGLRKRYPTPDQANESELRASVVTHLMMGRLGLPDERKKIVRSMLENMNFVPRSFEERVSETFQSEKCDQYTRLFDSYVSSPDTNILASLQRITSFILPYSDAHESSECPFLHDRISGVPITPIGNLITLCKCGSPITYAETVAFVSTSGAD